MGSPRQALAGGVDRSAEADRVIDYLVGGRRRLAVLYGRRGSRRRDLVQNWVIPRAVDHKVAAYYGDCEPDVPALVSGLLDTAPILDALRGGALVFLGQMERLLTVPDREKQRQLTELFDSVERGQLPGALVLLLPERNLEHLMAFQSAAPSLLANTLEVAVVTFRDSLECLSRSESGLEYAPDAIEALAVQLERNGDRDGVELARAVDRGFTRFREGASGVVTKADCASIGGVPGALEEYREGQVAKAAERWGADGRKAVEIVLEEVASALAQSVPPELDDLPFRIGISESCFAEIVDWLCRDGQLLRSDGGRRLEIVPVELRPGIEERAARNRRDVLRASALLREGVRSWSELGLGLPANRLKEIDAVREYLRVGEEEAALMVRSLLRVEGAQDVELIRHWLRRVRSRQRQVSLSIEAVFAERAEVRLRAVKLLEGFEESDVRWQLHRAAIEDPDRTVRHGALASLRNGQADELWPLISQEARDTGSPYQKNAVAALRLFPQPAAADLLRELVMDQAQTGEFRAEAIETLAALGTPEAVKTLVDIGLNHPNPVDRRNAAPALSSVDSGERVREAMEAIRESKAKLDQSKATPIRRALGAGGRCVLCVAAAVFGVVLAVVTAGLKAPYGLVILLSYVACLLVATRAAIVDERIAIDRWSGANPQRRPRWRIGRPLTVALLIIDLPVFAVIHGLTHLLAGRVRRAITLFALECLGTVCLAVSWFYFSGSDTSNTAFSEEISNVLMVFYVALGLVLYIGTFIWDVAAVADEVVFYTRRRNVAERRAALYAAMACNPWAANYVLERAASGTRRDSGWARRLVRRTARVMPLAELIASLKTQSKRPRYLLEALKRLKTRDEMMPALALAWRDATPRLRCWIVDVLAGRPNERSLEQLKAFWPGLNWYGRLRYAIGVWHHRVRLWPKMVIFVGVLFLPMVLLALIEVDATFKDPARPILRLMQNQAAAVSTYGRFAKIPDAELVQMAEFLAKAHTARSLKSLTSLFREGAPYQSESLKKGIAGSLGIAACQGAQDNKEALNDKQRAELATVLAEGMKNGRLELVKGLAPIQQDAGRCGFSEASRQGLAQAASDLLKNSATATEKAQLAILGLDVARHPSSVAPLRDFVLQRTQLKRQDRKSGSVGVDDSWRELTRTALRALSVNGSPQASDALNKIGSDPHVSKSLQEEAKKLARESDERLSAVVKQPLDRGDYHKAYTEGLELLKGTPPDKLRFQLLVLLGQASYGLAQEPSEESKKLEDEAIQYFIEAKKIGTLDADGRRTLAASYVLRAKRSAGNNPGRASQEAAAQALKEDPEYADGYSTVAWLLQLVHQDKESLRYALTAVQKDPALAWSYELVRDAYLNQVKSAASAEARRQTVTDAIRQFEQLVQRNPDVMWPKTHLGYIYHEFMSEFDPKRAFARAYEIFVALDNQFGSQAPQTVKSDLDANLLEGRLTVSRYQEVIEIGEQLDRRLAEANSGLRVPVNLLRYTALVMHGDRGAALTQLQKLEKLLSNMSANTELDWTYDGTLRYLRAQEPQSEIQQRLIELLEAANSKKDAKFLTREVIPANLRALQPAARPPFH
jgi:HEAT repeats